MPLILIVEDEPVLAKSLADTLKKLGYEIVGIASSGNEAIELAEECKPDLLVIDIGLERDLDAIETCNRIQAGHNVPVIYIGSPEEGGFLKGAEPTRPYHILEKPVCTKELGATVAKAMQRHGVENQLQETEERFRNIIENLSDVFYQTDNTGVITYISPSIERFTDYTVEELVGRNLADFYVDHQERNRLIQRLIQDGSVDQFEARLRGKDGRIRWVSTSARLRKDEDGNVIGVEGMSRDLTERKHTEETLQENERFLSGVFACIRDGITVLDSDLTIVRVNPTMEQWYAHAMPLIGKKCYEAYRGRSTPCKPCPTLEVIATGLPKDGTLTRLGPDREVLGWVDLYSFPLFDETTGKVQGVIEYVKDVTARRQATQALEESEEMNRLLSEVAFEGIVIHEQGVLLHANRQFFEMFGYEPNQLIGKDVLSITVASEHLELVWRQVADNVEECYETVGVRKDGTTFLLEVRGRDCLFKGRKARAVAISDITQRKQAEESLFRSRRELQIRNRISLIFLTAPHDEIYGEVLKAVLEATDSKYGIFGYIDHEGSLVTPSATTDIWEVCRVQNKAIVYPCKSWAGIWGKALTEKRLLLSNAPSAVPDGHIPIIRNMAVPIVHREKAIGLLHVANKETDYDEKDRRLMETIRDHIAPTLHARLQHEREERDRKRAEDQIKTSLLEKEVLLREIHHRVKNNLALIHSLLRLQSRHAVDLTHRKMFEDSRDRIRSMALAHELLYQSKSLAHLSVRDFVDKLVDHLTISVGSVRTAIKLKKDIQDVPLGLNTLIPLGFLFTELVSNSLKHAFPDAQEGEIRLALKSLGEKEFELVVSDNGIGLPKEIDLEHPKTMGLDLLRIFVNQLEGELEFQRGEGTEFRIRFLERR
ncbi:PAS domain S-box protein [Thermodesulfobacteriota bacterium]